MSEQTMHLPPGNKIKQPDFGNNAEILAERMLAINWKRVAVIWFYLVSMLAVTLFVIVAAVRLAFILF